MSTTDCNHGVVHQYSNLFCTFTQNVCVNSQSFYTFTQVYDGDRQRRRRCLCVALTLVVVVVTVCVVVGVLLAVRRRQAPT